MDNSWMFTSLGLSIKHILGVKNDVSDILDLTFSMDADEEKTHSFTRRQRLIVKVTNQPLVVAVDDLKANTEYTGYTIGSSVVMWFWGGCQKRLNKEDMARLLQFVTGTSKVPLEGFKALQGISGPQRFQIHKAYGAPERLPSAHTWFFNQLDLPEYMSKEQLQGAVTTCYP
ncbi:putative HECT domain-containing protein [Helianthus annuus]|nr:putative HECT domain-containing protein [Helianthus annuus]